MYVPQQYRPDPADVGELLRHHRAADLITATPEGLIATLLPFVYVGPGEQEGAGEHGALLGHVARKNPQWRHAVEGEAMVIVRGPDGYISPSWYAVKREHGRVVPTWNYITAHVYGELRIHDDAHWVEQNVRRLTQEREGAFKDPWSVDDAPDEFIRGQLRAIVGVEVLITRVVAKWKLSQNRSAEDISGAIDGLTAGGDTDLAEAMRRTQPRTANDRVSPAKPRSRPSE